MQTQSSGLIHFIKNRVDKNFRGDALPFPHTKRFIKKNDFVKNYNLDNFYFVDKGIVEIRIHKPHEDYKILDFIFEKNFIHPFLTKNFGKNTWIEVHAITETQLEVINKEELLKTSEQSLLASRLSRTIIEDALTIRIKSEINHRVSTAEERYQRILIEAPHWVEKLPISKIARYLGIRPESLSRIRNKILNSKNIN